jgi:predicted ATPase
VAGRYRVVRRAADGGMGTVYQAYDTSSDSVVALKTLLSDPNPASRRRSRFEREAQVLSEIRHPVVVRYVDHGVSTGDEPFLVMDWVAGNTLEERLSTTGMTPVEALGLAERLAGGLAAVHARGVVHRDLKPSNVMLPGGVLEQAVIVDFGVARLARAESGPTTTGDSVGTPRYMAPEQIRNARTVDGKADVFALGCILFECLTRQFAFGGADPVSVLARILFEPLPLPSRVRPGLPSWLDDVVHRMLERDVARRSTAASAGEDLRSALATADPHLMRAAAAGVEPRAPEEWEATHANDDSDAPPPLSFQLGKNAVATAAAQALPPQVGVLIGRTDECARLVGLLRSGASVVSVWGSPGVGKTRLAVEAVRAIAAGDDVPWDALVFADLREARDADDIVRIVAREASVSLEASAEAREVALGRALAKLGSLLLIADPVEHVATLFAAIVRAFARVAPRTQVLATSRRKWSAPGAAALEVGPLPTGGHPERPSPSATLLLARMESPSPDNAAGKAQLLERAERLGTALEGIPLAIELSAAAAQILGLDRLLARLAVSTHDGAGALETVRGPMRQALDWSWNLLSEEEQLVWAQCSVFHGGFTLEAAEAVVRLPAHESAPIDAIVVRLRDHSLLQSWSVEDAGEVRLSMFVPVRDFGWDKLRTLSERSGTLRRHAAYYAEPERWMLAGSSAAALSRIERDADNLLAASEFSLGDEQGDLVVGLQALIALEPAISSRGTVSSYLDLLERAIDETEAVGERGAGLRMRARLMRARLDAPAGRTERAHTDLEGCLVYARTQGDLALEGAALLDIAVLQHLQRALPQARANYEAALPLLAASDLLAQARCLGNIGALCHDEGDFVGAAAFYDRAIALLEHAGESRQRANLIGNLAVLEQDMGRHEEAALHYQRALELLEPIRDARVLAINLGNQGALELEMGRADRATGLLERALALLSGSGDARSRALCLARLAAALSLRGRAPEAETHLTLAERLASDRDPFVTEAVALARGFLDIARAAESARVRGPSASAEGLASARARVLRVTRAREGESALRERSDDIRSMLRVLQPLLEATEAANASP